MRRKRIRILHFTYALAGGGAERQLKHVVNNLARDIFVSAVCCADAAGGQDIPPDVSIFEIRRKHKFDLRWYRIADLMERWQPRIVHCWPPIVLWSSIPLARFLDKRPAIASFRNVYRMDRLPRMAQALGFLFADMVVSNVPTTLMKTPYRQLFQLKTGKHIPNSVDLDAVRSAEEVSVTEFGLKEQIPTALYAGRLVQHKNVGILIEGIAKLKNRGRAMQLLICGEGPEKKNLVEQVGTSDVREWVSFAGYQHSLYGIMKSCTLLVHPSLKEGMPNVVFEAMAARLPVVVSDIPVHRHWLTHGEDALLFESDNLSSLVENLCAIVTEPSQERIDRIDRAFALAQSLSISRMVANYEDLYCSAVESLPRS